MKLAQHPNKIENVVAFRTQAAALGIESDDPRAATTDAALLEARNNARRVVNSIGARLHEESRDFTDTELAACAEAQTRIAYVEHKLQVNGRAATGSAPGASVLSPPPGMSSADWQRMIGATASSPVSSMTSVEGQRVPVISAADRGSVAQRFADAGLIPKDGSGSGFDGNPRNPERITFDDFVRGVAGVKVRPEAQAAIRASLSEGTGSSGGYLVPQIVIPELIEALLANNSLLQAGMRVVPLVGTASSWTYPVEAGIPEWAFLAENDSVTPSDPSYGPGTLTPRHARVKTLVSRELLQDSAIAMDSALQSVFVRSLAQFLDNAGLNGTGTPPSPKGLMSDTAIGSVAFGGSTGAAATDYTWLVEALTKLYGANAKPPFSCVLHPNQMLKLQGLKNSLGDAMRAPTIVEALKFCTTTQLPTDQTVGTSTDCSTAFVGNFSDLVLGMRLDMQILRADQVAADQGQVAFYGFSRFDFAVLRPAQFVKVSGLRA